jgi:hypothetical protein
MTHPGGVIPGTEAAKMLLPPASAGSIWTKKTSLPSRAGMSIMQPPMYYPSVVLRWNDLSSLHFHGFMAL